VTKPDAPYSIFLFSHDGGSFRGWYVNLEQPQRRTALGYDYEDELLDIWCELGAEPELLDEDELEEAVRRQIFSAERAAEIRTTAERLLRNPPWPTGWEDWQPDARWQAPRLPPGWDVVKS
jgi:predicted RNA-binding protein associated with RNAse of E/G family